MIAGDRGAQLDALIQANENEGAVELLEAARREGTLQPKGQLLLGVMLFLPPLGDYEGSREAFKSIEDPSLLGEAAIWLAYHYYTLYPEDDDFVQFLENQAHSATACYSLARYNAHIGEEALAREWNSKSLQIERFPNNLLFDLLHNLDLNAERRAAIFEEVESLVMDKTAETARISTAADLYQSCWDEFVLKCRLTSNVWQQVQKQFRDGAKIT